MALLKTENISVSYDGTKIIEEINIELNDGELVCLLGVSGSGKSTLFNVISGLLTPDSGHVLFKGEDITGRSGMFSYMLQKDYLFEWRSIYSNVMLGLEIQKKKSEKYTKRVDQMLKDYGLWDFRNVRPSQLSGGMRQRAALIRTLAMEPDLLLLDEPFSALDYQTRLNVCDDIGKIIKKEGKTAILVTHDISEAISMADRVIVLAARPAYVKKKIPIRFAMEERTPMNARSAPEFKTYFNAIWKELNEHD